MINTVIFGDCRDSMRQMIANGVKVQMCVTSPPYWNLRDYGHPGQLGLENTIQEYIANQVEVFSLVWDLLADDGTLWVNMGDSYASSWGSQGHTGQMADRSVTSARSKMEMPSLKNTGLKERSGLAPKNLIGQPWRLAFALQDAGWILRQDVIWHKPNPMPESTKDRFTKAHEYLFLLSKNPKYYFDQEAIKEECSLNTHERRSKQVRGWDNSTGEGSHGNIHKHGAERGRTPGNVNPSKGQSAYESGDEKHRTKGGLLAYARKLASSGSGTKNNDSFDDAMAVMPETRNKRSVWSIASEPFSGAHFATYPTGLVEPCVLAGSRPGDTVFDPYFGSGTTGQVAQNLGRNWIGCEINQEYEALQKRRTQQMGFEL